MEAPLVRDLGSRPLPDVWVEMEAFTAERTVATRDEIWFVEHPPVYTLGMRASREHLLEAGEIPVVQIIWLHPHSGELPEKLFEDGRIVIHAAQEHRLA